MADINLVSVDARTSVTGTDYLAIWPTNVTNAQNLQRVTLNIVTSYVVNSINTSGTYVRQDLITGKGQIYAGASVGAVTVVSAAASNEKVLLSDSAEVAGLKWGQVQTSTIADNAVTYAKLKPLQVGTTITAAEPTLNFTGAGLLTHSISGSITTVKYNGENYAAGTTVTIRVQNSATAVDLQFPEWKFVGFKPTIMQPNKTAILSITCFGSTASDCVAAWAVEI